MCIDSVGAVQAWIVYGCACVERGNKSRKRVSLDATSSESRGLHLPRHNDEARQRPALSSWWLCI